MNIWLEFAINIALIFLGLLAIIAIAHSFDGENTRKLRKKMRDEWDEEVSMLLDEDDE